MWYENPSLWTILEPLCYASYATLVYGELGFINFVDNSRLRAELNRTPIGDESNGAAVGDGATS